MLVLSRKINEKIIIGDAIAIQVLRLTGGTAKLGISAPAHVLVHRQEVYEAIQKSNREAVAGGRKPLPAGLKQLAPPKAKSKLSSFRPLKSNNPNQYQG